MPMASTAPAGISPAQTTTATTRPQLHPNIVDARGGIYGPYTGTWFESIRESDIEHILTRPESHDSGLCAADTDKYKIHSGERVASWQEF